MERFAPLLVPTSDFIFARCVAIIASCYACVASGAREEFHGAVLDTSQVDCSGPSAIQFGQFTMLGVLWGLGECLLAGWVPFEGPRSPRCTPYKRHK